MKEHPEGILIDAGELTTVTQDGARTFLDAARDIESAGARMVVCNLPPAALDVVKSVPGVRSQLAYSMSVDDARGSLRSAGMCSHELPANAVIVPLLVGVDLGRAVELAVVLGRSRGLAVGVLGFIAVPRELPIGSPMPEQEAELQTLLAQAAAKADAQGAPCAVHISRVRDSGEGLLSALSDRKASVVVLAFGDLRTGQDPLSEVANELLRKAPCEVLIARGADASRNGGAR
jgi:nucleotide-binding universal stress UspA family protein